MEILQNNSVVLLLYGWKLIFFVNNVRFVSCRTYTVTILPMLTSVRASYTIRAVVMAYSCAVWKSQKYHDTFSPRSILQVLNFLVSMATSL